MESRQTLLEQYEDRIMNLGSDPVSVAAARELMEMVVQFVCIRYPKQFHLEQDDNVLVNTLLGSRTDVNIDPLKTLFDNIPEDFAIMIRNPENGMYYLRGGIICSSIGWDLGTHLNKELKDIHDGVPDYMSKMTLSMNRYVVTHFHDSITLDPAIVHSTEPKLATVFLRICRPSVLSSELHGTYARTNLSMLPQKTCKKTTMQV
jgi:hypothetical protein